LIHVPNASFVMVYFLSKFSLFPRADLGLQSANLLLPCRGILSCVPPYLACLLRWGLGKFFVQDDLQLWSSWSLPLEKLGLQTWPIVADLDSFIYLLFGGTWVWT
jgi:hypothetical protein